MRTHHTWLATQLVYAAHIIYSIQSTYMFAYHSPQPLPRRSDLRSYPSVRCTTVNPVAIYIKLQVLINEELVQYQPNLRGVGGAEIVIATVKENQHTSQHALRPGRACIQEMLQHPHAHCIHVLDCCGQHCSTPSQEAGLKLLVFPFEMFL